MAPEIDFDVYGFGEENFQEEIEALARCRTNLRFVGPFRGTSDLPVERYSAFLFTSLWEGTPTTLINIGALGLPIVASDVGGVSEIVDDGTGWLVRDHTNAQAYIGALKAIHESPGEAKARATAMSERIRKRYSWEAFLTTLTSSPSFLQ
jgi:glycosyltransferase involved in cell wall biosynthesis